MDNLELIWKEGGVALNGVSVIVNLMNAMFGKISNMQNCMFNITIGSFDTSKSSRKG